MCLRTLTGAFIMSYSSDIAKIRTLIKNADAVVVGVGSGLTASGGLCYTTPELAEKWYPEYYAQGKRSIIDIMGAYWPNMITGSNATRYWGFWARHIWHIRYEPDVLPPYADLFNLISEKEHFIITTNVDGQLEKARFSKDKIFAPQGDYALLQCSKHCCDAVFYNRGMVESMIEHMPNRFEIRQEDIPKCPGCGAFLMPNLRCDFNFVEAPHIGNMNDYENFINSRQDKCLVFLELGVGFNTPGIIRLPFEQMTTMLPNATLIRINRDDVRMVYKENRSAILLESDTATALREIRQSTSI